MTLAAIVFSKPMNYNAIRSGQHLSQKLPWQLPVFVGIWTIIDQSEIDGMGSGTKQKFLHEPEQQGEELPVNNPLFVNSIQKGFEVLRAFSHDRRKLSLAEITRATGLDKSATQRFVFTLHALGYLLRDEQSKLYGISPKMLEFGYSYLHNDALVGVAQRYLVDIHRATEETVNLTVLEGRDVVIVSRIPSNHVISVNVQIGFRVPALYSAAGIVICAFLKEDKKRELLKKTKLQAYTEASVIDSDVMQENIKIAGEQGYFIAKSQFVQGDIGVAAPIFDSSGSVVAAINIAAPVARVTIEEAERKFVPEVVKAAKSISDITSRL